MLLPLDAGVSNEGEKLGAVMDHINGRFGTGTVKYGINKPHLGFLTRGNITSYWVAFTRQAHCVPGMKRGATLAPQYSL